jgi:hypothetical protein
MAKKTFASDPIQQLLKKKAFVRALPSALGYSSRNIQVNEYVEAFASRVSYSQVSQDQYLAELDPRSHEINNPLIYPDKYVKNDQGEITGMTYVARVSVALQQMIATKQCVHLFAKPPKFTSSRDGDNAKFTKFKEYWTQYNASCALYLMAKSALTTGDGAICFFKKQTGIGYKVWSYKDGDTLIPNYAHDGVTLEKFVRRYNSINNDGVTQDTIDIYTDITVQTLVLDGMKWKVKDAERPHGFMQIPIAYHREQDVAWGVGQDLIDKIERLLSDVRESNTYFAYGILFLAGQDVTMLPPKSTQGKVIISSDENSKAQLLEQNDISPSLKFEYEQYVKQLFRITGTVSIDPEVLKGGDQSGAYIKNLYNDAIQYAMDARPRWQPVLETIVSIIKESLGLDVKDTLGYKNLVVISEPDIYIPMNVAEEIRMVNESFSTGAITNETTKEVHPLAMPNELERYKSEKKEEDELTTSIGLSGVRKTTDTGAGRTA